jgi:hypothetical protein
MFDKVLVLNEGQCIYFGPTSQALAHFQGWPFLGWCFADSVTMLTGLGYACPPRRTVPDFLVSIGLKSGPVTPIPSAVDLSLLPDRKDQG